MQTDEIKMEDALKNKDTNNMIRGRTIAYPERDEVLFIWLKRLCEKLLQLMDIRKQD